MKLTHSHPLSGRGAARDQFRVRITGLAVATDRTLFAAGDREVKSFSPAGEFLGRFETRDAAWSVAVDEDSLWLGMQGRLERVDLQGNLIAAIDDARLGLLTGVAAHAGRLLAADATHKCLHLFQDGRWLRQVGDDVNTRGFMFPNGVLTVAFDPRNPSFIVAHPQKHRVERYDLDGKLIGKFGRFGHDDPADFGGCCNPTTCAVTPAGLVLVSEKAPPHVKVFNPEGEFLAMTPEDAFDASAKNQFLAADDQGRIYATDSVRGTIEAFDAADG